MLANGDRLPPTRELSNQIGLNRTTVSAAYSLLENEGLLRGHVGRGSYVNFVRPLTHHDEGFEGTISFASSRPAQGDFPVTEFQTTVREVLASAELPSILQLGSPGGYAPLRRYLLDEARREGTAAADDDILITSGCQQGIDLIQRVLAPAGSSVAVEDPVYHGVKNVFSRSGVRLLPVAVGHDGIDVESAARLVRSERPDLFVLTPNFQNPTGATMPLGARERLLAAGTTTVVENDIYGRLRYAGEPVPALKALDGDRRVLLVRSFSKVAFPGLRVGWIIGPRNIISRLIEAKQWCDLHTDQLSQAVLLRFSDSGRLAAHLELVRESGAERLAAALSACDRHLPVRTEWTQPQGGMSLWVKLPHELDATDLLATAEREGVSYLPGRHFAIARHEPGTLRLSFGALSPRQIEIGVERLGRVFHQALDARMHVRSFEPAPVIV